MEQGGAVFVAEGGGAGRIKEWRAASAVGPIPGIIVVS
jgi:hypothetical protein